MDADYDHPTATFAELAALGDQAESRATTGHLQSASYEELADLGDQSEDDDVHGSNIQLQVESSSEDETCARATAVSGYYTNAHN